MLEPWEKALFNFFLIAAILLLAYTSVFYLPDYVLYGMYEVVDYFPSASGYVPGDLLRRLRQLYGATSDHVVGGRR